MLKTKDELEKYYNTLEDEFEGYIQISDERIKHIFKTHTKLPKWEELHSGGNYILEMALYNPKNKQSILIRQQNDHWFIIEKELKGDEPTDSFFTLEDNLKMKIAQIWEEEKDEFCNNWNVLEPKYLLFAGFKSTKGDKS